MWPAQKIMKNDVWYLGVYPPILSWSTHFKLICLSEREKDSVKKVPGRIGTEIFSMFLVTAIS